VVGCRISTLDEDASLEQVRMRTTKAPYKAKDTRAADPIAKPLPTAAVVLPRYHHYYDHDNHDHNHHFYHHDYRQDLHNSL